MQKQTFIELYQQEKGVTLTEREKKLIEDTTQFRFIKTMKFCDICNAPLTTDEKRSINIMSQWKTCHAHRHLANVPSPDVYHDKYGTFDFTEKAITDLVADVKADFKELPFLTKFLALFNI